MRGFDQTEGRRLLVGDQRQTRLIHGAVFVTGLKQLSSALRLCSLGQGEKHHRAGQPNRPPIPHADPFLSPSDASAMLSTSREFVSTTCSRSADKNWLTTLV
jgi:hypothetical protein